MTVVVMVTVMLQDWSQVCAPGACGGVEVVAGGVQHAAAAGVYHRHPLSRGVSLTSLLSPLTGVLMLAPTKAVDPTEVVDVFLLTWSWVLHGCCMETAAPQCADLKQ